MKVKRVRWIWFALALSLLYAFSINLLEFTDSPETRIAGFVKVGLQWVIVSLVSTGILGLISANRIVFAFLFPILMTLSAVEVFYRHTLGVGITGTTIEIALENNAQMWLSVIDFRLISVVLFTIIVSFAIVWYRWKYVFIKRKTEFLWLPGFFILSFAPFAIPRIYGAVSNRMPYAIYNGTADYLRNKKVVNEERNTFDNIQVRVPKNSPNVVVVVGESLRGDHLPMNNYDRMTMPYLSKEENLIAFKDIKSSGFHTYQALPYIFTRADSLNSDPGYEEQSFITIFKKAGYKSSWIANQDISASYYYFAREADTLIHVNSQRSLYSYDKWTDMETIPHFKTWKEANSSSPTLTIIHSIGSHWWSKSHYLKEDALFLPDMDSKEISLLDPQQIINSYDNSIVATDRFLYSIIEELRDDNAILIYVSDHGESLGENGRWLHGSDSPELHNIAAMVWFSSEYFQNFPQKITALEKNVSKPSSSDDLFYSVMDAAGFVSPELDFSKSWFFDNEESN
ncbi:MAG: sulfatase-like hydrolase/transferase [Muribaculaceae bacterium]|nr:sulfatase-like hydrolase/transferase [Muribaculaceae bacterium]